MSKPEANKHDENSADARWAAVTARNHEADGSFVYGVKTTGIFCVPSCPSRRAKRENVLFFRTNDLAVEAGFRPCQRCRPDQAQLKNQQEIMIEDLCRFITQSEQEPNLAELSARAGLSSYHLHRLFKRITGLTPKGYARANRIKRVRASLAQGNTITDAALDAGYNSSSRFYAESQHFLGMKPTQYTAGGKNMTIYFAIGECSLGSVLVAQSELGICAITLGDDPEILLNELQERFSTANLMGGDSRYETLVAQVIGFIEKPKATFDLPLDIRGTLFQQRVWQALQHIKPGETLSYSQLAERVGSPKAVRAVASACAANILAVAIPCHRIVRTNGELSGYRWGVDRKRTLLERERTLSEK
jgi:AraC family transcriptional regulator, regulatory protein of adaptative response / methylated-DNA-[protein]-cysteine methyltransferase